MDKINVLPTDLAKAARTLEERFELLHIPSRRIAEAEWNQLPEAIKRLIPAWIPVLLARYCLVGGVLEYRDRKGPYVRQFAFFEPLDYGRMFQEGSLLLRLTEFQLLPFGNEADGNVWITGLEDGPASAIHLVELSDWNGAQPSKTNGLVFASNSLACLLAAMGVSEASYYSEYKGQRSVLWCEKH